MKKKQSRLRRAKRVRAQIDLLGAHRLCVFRTPRHIYAQIIADDKVLASASTVDKDLSKTIANGGNVEAAKSVGKAIAEHQSIQNYLADMACRLDAARLMTLSTCRRKDAGVPYTRQAAQAKLVASEASVWCALKGIQIHGGYGYVKEFNVERYLRDSKITEIYEGTSEIQRLVIASQLLQE